MRLGSLQIEAGGMRVRVGPLRVPDGLHIWWGGRGVHLWWKHSKYQPRIVWDRLPTPPPKEGPRT